MRAADSFDDIECECWCCEQYMPVRNDEELEAVWISTMAFVAVKEIEIEDAESGMTICSRCAVRYVGPDWRELGQWKAAEYKAWCQVDDMVSGRYREHVKH
jgi:hypothetical protein